MKDDHTIAGCETTVASGLMFYGQRHYTTEVLCLCWVKVYMVITLHFSVRGPVHLRICVKVVFMVNIYENQ